MKRFGLAIGLAFGVMGCGEMNVNGDPQVNVDAASTTDEKPTGKPGTTQPATTSLPKWDVAVMQSEHKACVEAATNPAAKNPVPTQMAKVYCTCVLNEMERRFPYPKTATEAAGYQKVVTDDGTIKACIDKAKAETAPKLLLKKGMNKEDVKASFGTPTAVEETYDGLIEWQYNAKEFDFCGAPSYWYCTITFSKEGKVILQDGILGKYIDLESF